MPESSQDDQVAVFRKKIKYIVVIYQENWSFDGLYGMYHDKRVNNLLGSKYLPQLNLSGDSPLKHFPDVLLPDFKTIDHRFDSLNKFDPDLKPYDFNRFIHYKPDTITGDMIHNFYHEQRQIHGGNMDEFVAWSNNGGLVMSYYADRTVNDSTPEEKLARRYTLCDNFFHSAFGGSFLNHIWLISASMPKWDSHAKRVPLSQLSIPGSKKDWDLGLATIGKDTVAINTTYSINFKKEVNSLMLKKYNKTIPDSLFMPSIKNTPTIGDRLSQAGNTWIWYSGGWDSAKAGKPDLNFQLHHQPFVYFDNFKDTSSHLRDGCEFGEHIASGTLPQVSFVKAIGELNEHPGYASVMAGQRYVDSLVNLIMQNPKYKDSTAIIIAYDENGGRWDHVKPPPSHDGFGPGTRVPAIVISKYAKRNYVDSTQYETVSILKFIETLFKLTPLTSRDAKAENMLNAFDFKQ